MPSTFIFNYNNAVFLRENKYNLCTLPGLPVRDPNPVVASDSTPSHFQSVHRADQACIKQINFLNKQFQLPYFFLYFCFIAPISTSNA